MILVDGQIAYIGGQCIAKDYQHWLDYNQKIIDPVIVKKIYLKLLGQDTFTDQDVLRFLNNDWLLCKREESIYNFFDSFISTAASDLYIEMAYLGMRYVSAIKSLLDKKVNVYLLVSKKSDTYQNTNMLFLEKLMLSAKKSPYLHIRFYDGQMVHTKGMVTQNAVVLGAANFSNASGYDLAVDEQDFYSTDQNLVSPILSRFQEDFKGGSDVKDTSDLPKHSRAVSYFERFSLWLASYLMVLFKGRVRQARMEGREVLSKLLQEKEININEL